MIYAFIASLQVTTSQFWTYLTIFPSTIASKIQNKQSIPEQLESRKQLKIEYKISGTLLLVGFSTVLSNQPAPKFRK